MEKETFVKIVDAVDDFVKLSRNFNGFLGESVDFGMDQIDKIVEALEIEFEDEERWIRWWLFEGGEKKEFYVRAPSVVRKYYKEVYEAETSEQVIKVPTAGDLYDWLDWNMANS